MWRVWTPGLVFGDVSFVIVHRHSDFRSTLPIGIEASHLAALVLWYEFLSCVGSAANSVSFMCNKIILS